VGGKQKYRVRNWRNDLSKDVLTALYDIMDLKDDRGVRQFKGIAESVLLPDKQDKNFCQTWAENVLEKAAKNGLNTRDGIGKQRARDDYIAKIVYLGYV